MGNYRSAENGLLYDLFGKLRGYYNPVTKIDVDSFSASVPVLVSANVTITSRNEDEYDGKTLEFSGAYTVTLSAGLSVGFGFAVIPPASGNASIASDGTVQLNGATTTLTRAAASNAAVAVIQRASSINSYVVTGS